MKRVVLLVIVCTFLLGASALAETSRVTISEVRRADRTLTFDLATPGGPLLEADAFRVTVNDLPAEDVEVLPSSGGYQNTGAVLVMDTSGSMKGAPIRGARRAVDYFIRALDPKAQVGMVAFSSTSRLATGFTTDHKRVRDEARKLVPSGETALYDGLLRAIDLVGSRPAEQRNIVLLTDGGDTASRSSLGQVIAQANGKGSAVYIVGLKSPEYSPASIRRLADETGGRFTETSKPKDLAPLFSGMANTLVSSYRIRLTNPDVDATLGELEVTVDLGTTSVVGTKVVRFAEDEPEPTLQRSMRDTVTLGLLLLMVFLSAGALATSIYQQIRLAGSSPADRVSWYDAAREAATSDEALLNAVILERAKDLATKVAGRMGYLERLEREVDAAGMKWRPGEVIIASLLVGLAGSTLAFVLANWMIGLAAFVIAGSAPWLVIKFKASKRRRAFQQQLSDVLLLMTGALRAGYSLQQALQAAAEDARSPAREEFRRVMTEVKLGSSLDDALRAMSDRIGVLDFEWTILAIQIQRDVGGDLAEILEIIADTIRERERLRGQLKALTAEGRLSALILGALPFVMGTFLFIRNPEYLEPLYTTSKGMWMIGGSTGMMLFGFVWMRKIIRIEV